VLLALNANLICAYMMGMQSPEDKITEAAKRAFNEAQERRKNAASKPNAAKEVGGREGPDPARYGDWEVKGIASDF
jgi:hypothetical protein